MTENTIPNDVEQTPVNPTTEAVEGAPVEEAPTYNKNRPVRVVLTVTAIILALLLCAAGFLAFKFLGQNQGDGTDTAGITWVRSIYAIGDAPKDNIAPTSVAPSADGNRWFINDAKNGRIIEARANLSVANVESGDGDGNAYYQPARVFVTRDGVKLVGRTSSGDIWGLDENNNRVLTITGPVTRSLAANDEMIVVGVRNGFVAYTREGEGIGTVGTAEPGKGEEQFDGVNGIWVDDQNNVYTTDTGNNRLAKWDDKGDLVWIKQLGIPNNAGENFNMDEKPELDPKKYPAKMQYPMGITMDGAGRLIVADMLDFSLNAFDPETGDFLAKYGAFGEKDGQLNYPVDIKYNPADDTFMVAEANVERAQIIRLPDSGGNMFAGLRSLLNGPLGACLFPLLILLLILIVYFVTRTIFRKRRERIEDELAEKSGVVIEQTEVESVD